MHLLLFVQFRARVTWC